MSQKHGYMKNLIALSFKRLLREHSFEKITIRMIADGAGIIRSTFYHHFKDKQDLLEWIIREEIIVPCEIPLREGCLRDSAVIMLQRMTADREFYYHSVRVSGQNGFGDILHAQICPLIHKVVEQDSRTIQWHSPLLNSQVITEYYTNSLIFSITQLLAHEELDQHSAEEIIDAYIELAERSLQLITADLSGK